MGNNRRVVGYTTGVFDMFHVGHLRLLERARACCDHLIVGVTADKVCFERKKRSPIIPQCERIEIVRAVRFVDEVVVQNSMDKMRAWREHRFDVMFVGDDWKGTPQWVQYEAEFARVGVKIVYFPYTSSTSSTMLRAALLETAEQHVSRSWADPEVPA